MLLPSYYFFIEPGLFSSLFVGDSVIDVLKTLPVFIRKQKLGKIDISLPNHLHLENPELISIGEGTIIEPGVYIKGPAIIGRNCQIRHGAYIRENVILGDGSVVGHNSEIKNSILFPGAYAAHFNYVGDSILGSNTNLGAGVICANFRLDEKEIFLKLDEKKQETHLKKLGVILGDRSKIGCNTVINPGTLIGKDVLSPGGIVLSGFIPARSKIVTKSTYSIEGIEND